MHRIIYVILSLAICPTLSGCPSPADQTGKIIDETLFKDLPAKSDQNRPGWIVCVLKKGKPVYQRAFGMADVEKKIPITSQTAFDVATLSRYFTGATVALLMENGALRLEDDIRTFIPEMPKQKDPITLEHLIYHTSGIPDYREVMKKAGVEKAQDDLAVVDMLAEAKLEFEPGSRHKISSSNYFLLAFVVQRLTSLSMGEWTSMIVFDPLGMEKSVFADHPEKPIENKATGYKRLDNKYVTIENPNPAIVGDTGLYMSMDQLIIWEKALYEKKIGGEIFRKLMERIGGTPANKQAGNYAFGLSKEHSDPGGVVWGHTDRWGRSDKSIGFISSYMRCQEKDLTFIALCNDERVHVGELAGFVGMYYLKDIRRPFDPVKDQGWDYLFNGKSFAGWEGNKKMFRITDGAIVGGNLKERIPRNEFLCSKKEYGDFILRLNVKLLGDNANAGIQIRSRRIPDHHEMIGYQADMGQHYWGALYDESRRRKVLAGPERAELDKVLKLNDWNDYMIKCQGKRIRLFINGFETVDYTEPDDSIEQTGIIGLQIHGGGPSEAWYKDIIIKEL